MKILSRRRSRPDPRSDARRLQGAEGRGGRHPRGHGFAPSDAPDRAESDLELVLLDLGLPDRDGLEMLSDLGNRYPTISVVVLSAQQDRDTVMKALDLGALGFIPKSGQREVMLSAFNLIFSGGVYIPPEILNRREPAAAARAAPAPAKAGASAADLGLTERQMQVLELHRSGHCRHCPRPRGGPGRPIDNARGCALRAHPQPTEAWGRFGKVQHAADSLRAAWRNWFGGCGMKPGCPLVHARCLSARRNDRTRRG